MAQSSQYAQRLQTMVGLGGTNNTATIQERLASIMGKDRAGQYLQTLGEMNARALGGAGKLVLVGGEKSNVPSLFFQMGRRNIALPIYDAQSRVATFGGQSYAVRGIGTVQAGGQITRSTGMDWFMHQIQGIKTPSSSLALDQLAGAGRGLRTKYGYHLRAQFSGGAAPFFRGDVHRIEFSPEAQGTTKLWNLMQEVKAERASAVMGDPARSLRPADVDPLTGRVLGFQALDREQGALGKLVEELQSQGFSAASKVTVHDRANVLTANTIRGGMFGTNVFYRPEKGPHHLREKELFEADKLVTRGRHVPYLLPETAADYMNVARGVARMRGIAPDAKLILDLPVRMGGLVPMPGIGAEHSAEIERILRLSLGDPSFVATSDVTRSMANASYERNYREVVIRAHKLRGRPSNWMLAPGLKGYQQPGIYNNVGIGASELMGALGGMGPHEAADAMYLGNSLTTTGAVGHGIKLRRGETIDRVLTDRERMRLVIRKRQPGGAGMRAILGGETRAVMSRSWNNVHGWDLITKLGSAGVPAERLMLHDMAARMAKLSVGGKFVGDRAQGILAGVLGGRVQEFDGQRSVLFGNRALKLSGPQIFEHLEARLQKAFGTEGFTVGGGPAQSLKQLLAPNIQEAPKEIIRNIARTLSHDPQEQMRISRQLYGKLGIASFETTLASRAAQPGFGGPMPMRMQKLNLLATVMGFSPYGNLEGIAPSGILSATQARNSAIRQTMGDYAALLQGDDALQRRLTMQGRSAVSLSDARQMLSGISRTKGRLDPSNAGFAFSKNAAGNWVPSAMPTVIDLGEAGARLPQALGADLGVPRRFAVMPAGLALGGRVDELLEAGGGAKTYGPMTRAYLELSQAIGGGDDIQNVVSKAGLLNARVGAKILGKSGWVNRQIMSGITGRQLGLLPESTLAPGEVGITRQLAKKMGLSGEMLHMAETKGVYGMVGSDPAFSTAHITFNRIRVVDRPNTNLYSLFTHAGDLPGRYRDTDADRMALFLATNKKQNQAFQTLFEKTGAVERSTLSRATYDWMSRQAGMEGTDPAKWLGNLEAVTPAKEMAGAVTKNLTTTGTRVPYAMLRPYREIAFGVMAASEQGSDSPLWKHMRLGGQLNKQVVKHAIERMIEAKQASSGALLEDIMHQTERVVYTVLNKKKSVAGGTSIAEEVVKGLVGYQNVAEADWNAHSKKVGGLLEQLIFQQMPDGSTGYVHPLTHAYRQGAGERVASAMGAAVVLKKQAKARSPLAAFTTKSIGKQHGFGPFAELLGLGRSLINEALGVASEGVMAAGATSMGPGEAGRIGSEATLRAGNTTVVSDTAKDLARGGKKFLDKLLSSRAGKIALGAGAALAALNAIGGNQASQATGGAPMPPEPMVNLPNDPGLMQEVGMGRINAPVQRVPGVRTHMQATVRTGSRRPPVASLGFDAYGRFGTSVVQSGSFTDDASSVPYKHEIERSIHQRLNSSF